MSSTLSMMLIFENTVNYNGTTTLPTVTSTKTFGSDADVQRFLTKYKSILHLSNTASASTIVGAWWDSTTNDIVLNTGCEALPITLT